MTLSKEQYQTMYDAGKELVRAAYDATGEIPDYLAHDITLDGDVDYIEAIAAENDIPLRYGCDTPAWNAVFDGTQDAIATLRYEEAR